MVEDDEHVGQVEQRLGQADRIRPRHRQLLPAGCGLVREVADTRCQRHRQLAVGRRIGQDATQRLERVVGFEAVQLGVVAVLYRGHAIFDAEDAASNSDHRVAAVAGATFDRFEDEGKSVA